MGTAGHMQHPFDVPNVRTGQDLIDYFEKIVEYLSVTDPETGKFANLGSVKWDGINVSFKLVDDPSTPTGKDFRMDRGTSAPSSVRGLTAADAYKKWPAGHGMPPAIEILLGIFNKALPKIKPELKALGMWDDPTKYFNTEFMNKGKPINVIEYPENTLAIHGVNQFYEKKAQAHRIRKGIGMDRPGLERPEWHHGINPDTGKKYKASEIPNSVEVDYDEAVLQSIINKVKPIAEEYEFDLVGDVPTELISEIDFEETLNTPFSVRITENETQTYKLRDWLARATNPFDAKVTKKIITQNPETGEDEVTGKNVWAISKDVYVAIEVEKMPLDEYLLDPERDAITAINGALFNHATRLLGIDVLRALNSTKGGLEGHEGVVLRGLEDRPLKVTGDFILKGMGGEIKKKMAKIKENSYLRGKPARLTKEAVLEQKEVDNDKRIIAIYPGRFQPMGKHHVEVYNKLLENPKYNEVYIATSNKTKLPGSPFDFSEKQLIAQAHGIDPTRVIMTTNPYYAREITDNYDPETTSVVYLVGAKDMRDNPRFARTEGTTKEGFDWKIEVAPHVEIDIPGFGEMCGTTCRKALKDVDPQTFEDIMGFYDPEIHDLIKRKLTLQSLEEDAQYHLGVFLRLIKETLDETNQDGTMFGVGRAALSGIGGYKDDDDELEETSTAAQKRISKKIPILKDEGYPHKQAIAIAHSMEKEGKLEEEEIEEISAMGGGAVQGASSGPRKNIYDDNIQEVLNYLLQISGEN